MDGVWRSAAVVTVVGLIALAGCIGPAPWEPSEGSDPVGTTTPGTETGGGQGTPTTSPTATEAATPTATPTPTPTPEPTPTVVSETGIRVVEINADVETVDDEYIVLRNTGEAPLDMSGWRVKDGDGHVYTFPEGYRLDIGDTVTLYSGRGTQSDSTRFWWSDGQVWDANGDTISIHDERGHKIYERSYS